MEGRALPSFRVPLQIFSPFWSLILQTFNLNFTFAFKDFKPSQNQVITTTFHTKFEPRGFYFTLTRSAKRPAGYDNV